MTLLEILKQILGIRLLGFSGHKKSYHTHVRALNVSCGLAPISCPKTVKHPACAAKTHAAGDTEDKVRRNIQNALAPHFEAIREGGEPVPEPHPSVDYVEVAA